MNRYSFLLAALLLIAGCGQNTSSQDSTEGQAQAPAAEQAPAVAQLPSVPLDTMTMLYEKCDYIDFIFYTLNFSVNQAEKASIQGTLRHIAQETPVISPNCRPQGRIFFQVDGRNALQGDFSFGEGCFYYIFYDDKGKAIYANKMTAEGVQFFQNLLARVMQGQQGQ